MREKNSDPQKGVWALVSGAGRVTIMDGLESAIMIEKLKNNLFSKSEYHTHIIGNIRVIVIIDGEDKRFHLTGPFKHLKKDELLQLSEVFRRMALDNDKNPPK